LFFHEVVDVGGVLCEDAVVLVCPRKIDVVEVILDHLVSVGFFKLLQVVVD